MKICSSNIYKLNERPRLLSRSHCASFRECQSTKKKRKILLCIKLNNFNPLHANQRIHIHIKVHHQSAKSRTIIFHKDNGIYVGFSYILFITNTTIISHLLYILAYICPSTHPVYFICTPIIKALNCYYFLQIMLKRYLPAEYSLISHGRMELTVSSIVI